MQHKYLLIILRKCICLDVKNGGKKGVMENLYKKENKIKVVITTQHFSKGILFYGNLFWFAAATHK